MSIRRTFTALAVGLACATALSGCLTPHAKPTTSKAILDARARVGAKTAACSGEALDAVSPVNVGFAFDDAAIDPAAQRRLAAAAKWLACNAGVEAVILPDADNHGSDAHMAELAQQRAVAVQAQLRTLGATSTVIHMLPRGGKDPVSAPHMLLLAEGRGW